jgi:amino acid adenylation domain-containing protein
VETVLTGTDCIGASPDAKWLLDNGHVVDEIFAQRAAETPDRIAVIDQDRSLRYRDVESSSDALATALVSLGALPGDIVGMCLPRTVDVVVAVLGIFKAGCGYLPLDPTYPRERLAYMVRDAGASLVVTTAAVRDSVTALRGETGAVAVELETVADSAAPAPALDSTRPRGPDDIAYVLYTSGSTGEPKAVPISHRSVVALFGATWRAEPSFRFTPADVWTQFHSYSFDFSVWEMWGALLYGGTLVVVGEEERSPEAFVDLLRRTGATIVCLVPSAFRYVAKALEADPEPALAVREIVLGGETVDLDAVALWIRTSGLPHVINIYGLTENTVMATYKKLTHDDAVADHRGGSPIGRVLPHLEILLLDAQLQPVPAGETGEVFIAGVSVSASYRDRPDLNAQRFLEFGGKTYYRTGDLATQNTNGELMFRGRFDDQVNVRGYRIELGEIETALRRIAGVTDAIAVVGQDGVGEPVLTAFYATTTPLTASALRERLGTTLPRFMIPSQFVELEAIPISSSGKADRRLLAERASARRTEREERSSGGSDAGRGAAGPGRDRP